MLSTIITAVLIYIPAISAKILAAVIYWASRGTEPANSLLAGVARSTERWPVLIIAGPANYFRA